MKINKITYIKTDFYKQEGITFKMLQLFYLGGIINIYDKADILAIEALLTHFKDKEEVYSLLEYLLEHEELSRYKEYLY